MCSLLSERTTDIRLLPTQSRGYKTRNVQPHCSKPRTVALDVRIGNIRPIATSFLFWCNLGTMLPAAQRPRGVLMAKVPGIVKQLKKERDKVERQLSGLNAAL